jgi:serine/threonine-protein kinase
LELGTDVTIYVSSGPADEVVVPDVAGLSEIDAANVLSGQGFDVAFFEQASGVVPPGRVVRTQPAAGAVAEPGETVTVILATEIPDIVGLDVDEAIDELRRLGLNPTIEIIELPPGDGRDGIVMSYSVDPTDVEVIVLQVGFDATAD